MCNSCKTPFPINNFASTTSTIFYGSEENIGLSASSTSNNTDICKAECLSQLECRGIKIVSLQPFNCRLLIGTGNLQTTGALARLTNVNVSFLVECPGVSNFRMDPFVELTGATLLSIQLPDTSQLATCQRPTELLVTVRVTQVAASFGPVYGSVRQLNIGFVSPKMFVGDVCIATAMIVGAVLVAVYVVFSPAQGSRKRPGRR